MSDCIFCDIVSGDAPATIVGEWDDALAFIPLGPITNTHTLIIPKKHVKDALENAFLTGIVFQRAAEFSKIWKQANIWTSAGKAAKQSIFHLHVHVIERVEDDQLLIPYGTTGNPHDPHWCKTAQKLKEDLELTNKWLI